VEDYINAGVNTSSNPYNMSGIMGRYSLSFINQNVTLYGADISGKKLLGKAFGEWILGAAIDYTRGTTTDDANLYNIMPLNARLSIDHILGSSSNTLEQIVVGAKDDISIVRGEATTAGYALTNYRSTYEFTKSVKINLSVDNLSNYQYELPLGGLEYVTGNMMNAPKPVRAIGRSVNASLSISF
jgi:iron complex outermembrane recepter protein